VLVTETIGTSLENYTKHTYASCGKMQSFGLFQLLVRINTGIEEFNIILQLPCTYSKVQICLSHFRLLDFSNLTAMLLGHTLSTLKMNVVCFET